MNLDRLRHMAERADLGAQREALFAVEIPEAPGSFLRFCELLGRRSVTGVQLSLCRPAGGANIPSGLGLTQGKAGAGRIAAQHRPPRALPRGDMTDNEMAKLHVRYMVGGHPRRTHRRAAVSIRVSGAPRRAAEVSPGHRHRLEHQPISLPQSRLGLRTRSRRGIQVPAETRTDFLLHLNELHYAYTEETDNPAYKIFLGG